MAKSFTDIADTQIDAESPVNETLESAFYDRDEALISGPVDLRFEEASHTGDVNYAGAGSADAYFPHAVGTSGGDVTLELVVESKVDAGNGYVRARIGSGTYVEVGPFTNTDYEPKTISLPAADVASARDTVATVTIEHKVDNAANTVTTRNISGGASRFERAA